MDNLLNRSNATVGTTVLFRGKSYVIDEICQVGVWMRRTRKGGKAWKGERREFIHFHEAPTFNVTVLYPPA